MKQKKSIQAKIVKHAHRRRFQEYVREKGRDKMTLGYVYWAMYHRSGKGNVFELEEGLFLADLGIGKNALRPARKTLFNDGWLSKAAQKIDPLTGKWGTTAWTVNTEPVAHSEGDGTAAPFTGDRSADVGSAGDRSAGDTGVLHLLYGANAPSTSSRTPSASTSSEGSESASELVSESKASDPQKQKQTPAAPSDLSSEDKSKTNTNPQPNATALTILGCLHPFSNQTISDEHISRLNTMDDSYPGVPWVEFFAWNRSHKPPQLRFRSVDKFLEGVNYAMDDFWHHGNDDGCAVCKRLGQNNQPENYSAPEEPEQWKCSNYDCDNLQTEGDGETCHECRVCCVCGGTPGSMMLKRGKNRFNQHKVRPACDACYDKQYEWIMSGRGGLRQNIIDPRPGYKAKAVAAGFDEEEA